MNKADEILARLSAAPQPVIDNPEELTGLIMSAIEQDSARSPNVVERVLIPVVRAILSLAAIWSIGFFIYLQIDDASSARMETTSASSRDVTIDRASTLKEAYKDYLCNDCRQTISYTKLRSKRYENK